MRAQTRVRSLVVMKPLLAGLLLALLSTVLWPDAARAQEAGEPETDQVVVKLNSAANCAATVGDINRTYGTTTLDGLLNRIACIYLLRVPAGQTADVVAGEIAGDARVQYAEPNFVTEAPEGDPRARAHGGDTDPVPFTDAAPYTNQYAVNKMRLPQAHGITRGRGAVVAVLDTGVQLDHPRLTGGLTVARYDFIEEGTPPADESNGVDDDGDGEVDEQAGHGTHVAGVVRLTAPEAKVMPLRVLDSDGVGNVFVIAEAAQYAVRNGADVVNLSLGSDLEPGQNSQLLADVTDDLARDDDDDDDDGPDAIEGVPREGVVVVGAAGNTNSSDLRYPAAEEGAIAVAAVNEQERKVEFSNYGAWIDVAAPGDGVYSTFPTSRYATWDGTSMATPFVAGQAALIRAMRPAMPAGDTPGTVGGLIRNTARTLADTGVGGHADAAASLRALNTAPRISSMSPRPGATIKNRRPAISAVVRDRDTNLAKANIRLFVDGKLRGRFSYNRSTDRLVYRSPRLSYKRHSVRIVATDAQGKRTIKAWRFRVVR